MKARALVTCAVLASGCGLAAVGTGADPTGADAGLDAAHASDASGESDTSDEVDGAADATEIPGTGSSEVPLADLDGGVDADLDAGADGSTAPPSFEIVAPAGGKFRIFPPGTATPCSVGAGQPAASFTVKNFGAQQVRVWWVDYACLENNYGTVSPGNAKTQPTYVGHRWRIRSAADGGLRGDFVLDAPGTYQVLVH